MSPLFERRLKGGDNRRSAEAARPREGQACGLRSSRRLRAARWGFSIVAPIRVGLERGRQCRRLRKRRAASAHRRILPKRGHSRREMRRDGWRIGIVALFEPGLESGRQWEGVQPRRNALQDLQQVLDDGSSPIEKVARARRIWIVALIRAAVERGRQCPRRLAPIELKGRCTPPNDAYRNTNR